MIEKWIQTYKIDNINIDDKSNNNYKKKNCYLNILVKALKNKEMIADVTTVLQVTTHTTGLAINQCILYLAKLGIKTQNIYIL